MEILTILRETLNIDPAFFSVQPPDIGIDHENPFTKFGAKITAWVLSVASCVLVMASAFCGLAIMKGGFGNENVLSKALKAILPLLGGTVLVGSAGSFVVFGMNISLF